MQKIKLIYSKYIKFILITFSVYLLLTLLFQIPAIRIPAVSFCNNWMNNFGSEMIPGAKLYYQTADGKASQVQIDQAILQIKAVKNYGEYDTQINFVDYKKFKESVLASTSRQDQKFVIQNHKFKFSMYDFWFIPIIICLSLSLAAFSSIRKKLWITLASFLTLIIFNGVRFKATLWFQADHFNLMDTQNESWFWQFMTQISILMQDIEFIYISSCVLWLFLFLMIAGKKYLFNIFWSYQNKTVVTAD
ncbi:MAG: hypothetical protein M3Q56_04635 [Bacteroidota bacterium]|nr:hypothetical protein [Bacteroidota bacterium]